MSTDPLTPPGAPATAGPILLSTWSFGRRGHDAAWPALAAGGSCLDAAEAACRAVEADPEVDSVGRGGLPDRDGQVTLDGCIMLGPDRNGSVCAIRRHLHPVSIARLVMERTSHTMLAGSDADDFADAHDQPPAALLTDEARQAWERWTRQPHVLDQSRDGGSAPLKPEDQPDGGRLFELAATGEERWRHHDTIGVLAIDSRGRLAGACSTSGTPFKIPGRVGDSPIIGHGLYVDPEHGAATATGTGELISGVCGSFLAVELMRSGRTPREALREVLRRIRGVFSLRPEHQVALIALRPDGTFATAALRPGYRTAVRTLERDEVVEPDDVLLEA